MLGAGRCAVTLVAALTVSGCRVGPSLEEYRRLLAASAGSGASDCGFIERGASKTAAVSCVESALVARRPVFAAFQVHGIDSQIFIGLAISQAGKSTRLIWDSDVSGGRRLFGPKSRINQEPCEQPSVSNDRDVVHCGQDAGGS